MTKFYERQPDMLPKTLPEGTRNRVGSYAAATVVTLLEGKYRGQWRNLEKGSAAGGYLHPENIDWTSVPLPAPEAPAEPPCEACGADRIDVKDQWRFGLKLPDRDEGRGLFDVCGSCARLPYDVTLAAIRARRGKCEHYFPRGGGALSESCDRCGLTAREAYRQERAAQDDGPEPDCHCGHSGCSRCDKPTDAPLCSTPLCAARGVVATNDGRCVYCHDSDRRDDFETMMGMTRHPGDSAAGERLAAWERAERPRGNPTERKMLAAGHPAGWPSNEGEE